MPLLDKLERKLGRYAIPGLVNILGGLQIAVWALAKFQPDFEGALFLINHQIMEGEVWRLFTWALIPASSSVLFIFTVMIMFMISDGLDREWGPFRVNLYVFGTILFVAVGEMLLGPGFSTANGQYLYWTLFLAFAVYYPDMEFLLFFILPFKVKYLAWLLGGKLLLDVIDTPQLRLTIILTLMSFFIAFGGRFLQMLRQKGKVSARRARFEGARQPDAPTLHRCHGCGKTEQDDPKLDFRVGADGEDYCSECRAKRSAA